LVFLGGCATGLLISDAGAPPMRMTRDVDVIAEVASLSDYHGLSARLAAKGSARICPTVRPSAVGSPVRSSSMSCRLTRAYWVSGTGGTRQHCALR
jgi:hypothetical protein